MAKILVCLEVQMSFLGPGDSEMEVEMEKMAKVFEVQANSLGPEDLKIEVDSQETLPGHARAEQVVVGGLMILEGRSVCWKVDSAIDR